MKLQQHVLFNSGLSPETINPKEEWEATEENGSTTHKGRGRERGPPKEGGGKAARLQRKR